MKKGHSKNRHFSKGIDSLKRRKKLTNRKGCKRGTAKSANLLAEKSFRWSRIGTAIQLADFLTDNVSRFIKWLLCLLGME